MLGFHDVAVVLYIATSDFPTVFIAETLHSEAVFQHTLRSVSTTSCSSA